MATLNTVVHTVRERQLINALTLVRIKSLRPSHPQMLVSLPPELLVQVFKNLPSFEAILALRDADDIFARVWELNRRTILTAQVDVVRHQDHYVLEGSALGAYHTLLKPHENRSLNPWKLLGSSTCTV
ncbi:MAG: hypothetical protein Q9173_004655 [Seirophora scorigena]